MGVWFDFAIGVPQLPEMSFGVIRDGTLPKSIPDGAGFGGDGSRALHGLGSLAEAQGSNMLFEDAVMLGICAGLDAGLGARGCEADKLKGDSIVAVGLLTGDVTLGMTDALAGPGGFVVLANPPKSSEAKKSTGIEVGAGFGVGFGAGAAVDASTGCGLLANPKSRPSDGTGLGVTSGFESALSKKLPPLRGGGDVICGADSVVFGWIADGKPVVPPENELFCIDDGGDFVARAL